MNDMSHMIHQFSADFDRIVGDKQNSPAFIVGDDLNGRVITYLELSVLLNQCLSFFQSKGLKPGSTILTLMPNTVETLVLFLASIKGGYNFSPLPCTSTPIEVQRWCRLVKPDICFTTELVKPELLDTLLEQKVLLYQLKTNAEFSWLRSISNEDKPLLGKEPRIYLATSGTTGEPKVMVIDSNRLWSSGRAFVEVHQIEEAGLRFWNYLPMSYLGGLFNLTLIPLCMGGSILVDDVFSGKSFFHFWQTIDRFEIDALWFVPSIVLGLLKMFESASAVDMKKRAERVKVAFLGTAPIALERKEKFKEVFGITLLENFGLSETTFCSTETIANTDETTEGSVGKRLPYVQLKLKTLISADDGTTASEILIKSPMQFLGYLQKNGAIEAPFDAEGFFPSGDLGYLAENDILCVTGRKRDIIKKGGYLIALREIEVLVENHPSVKEAAAVKHAHPFYGESYSLFVSGHNHMDMTEKEISYFIHQNLVSHKWPDRIIIKDEFLYTRSGKIKKHLLLESVS